MTEFLHIALSFPTVVYSAILLVAAAYWLMVILGAIDLDILNLDLDADLDLDVDLDVDADIGLDVDIDLNADGDLEAGPGAWVALASVLGLGTVPVTVILSFLMLCAWLISFASVYYLGPFFGGDPGPLVALLLGSGSLAVALLPTILIMRPFIHFFKDQEEPLGGESLIGTVCEIETTRVDAIFGRAKLADGGAGLLLAVRCADPDNGLRRGAQALIIDYDMAQHTYLIEPYDVFLSGVDATSDEQAVVFEEQSVVLEEMMEQAAQNTQETLNLDDQYSAEQRKNIESPEMVGVDVEK